MQCRKLAEGIGVPLDYELWAGTANSKILNWPIFESNRIGTADLNQIESRSFAYFLVLEVTISTS